MFFNVCWHLCYGCCWRENWGQAKTLVASALDTEKIESVAVENDGYGFRNIL